MVQQFEWKREDGIQLGLECVWLKTFEARLIYSHKTLVKVE